MMSACHLQDNFFEWVSAEERLGKITFEVKGEPRTSTHANNARAAGESNIVPLRLADSAPDPALAAPAGALSSAWWGWQPYLSRRQIVAAGFSVSLSGTSPAACTPSSLPLTLQMAFQDLLRM